MQRTTFATNQVDGIIFDVIGTLVDEAGAWAAAAQRLAVETGVSAPAGLRVAWAGRLQDQMQAVVSGDVAWRPHRQLVVDAAREAVADAGGSFSAAASSLAASLDRDYRAWPEVAPATADLRRDRLVAALSNADVDSLVRLANTNDISWDTALSAGTAGVFKPASAAYRYAIDALQIEPARTLFVAAHPWDLRAAAEHGFRTAYIARPGADRPTPEDGFDLAVADLTGLADALSGPRDRPRTTTPAPGAARTGLGGLAGRGRPTAASRPDVIPFVEEAP